MREPSSRIRLLTAGALLAVLLFSLLISWTKAGFLADEAYWISEGRYLHLDGGEAGKEAWEDYWARRRPPLVKYIYGLASGDVPESLADLTLRNAYRGYRKSTEALAELTPPGNLFRGRVAAFLFALGTGILLWLIGRRLAGPSLAWTAVIIYSLDTFILTRSVRAVALPVEIFLACLMLYAALRYFSEGRRAEFKSKSLLAAAPLSLVMALSLLAHQAGFLSVVFFALTTLLFGLLASSRDAAGTAWGKRAVRTAVGTLRWAALAAVTAAVSLAVAVIFNPHLHREPLRRLFAGLSLMLQDMGDAAAMEAGLRFSGLLDRAVFFTKHAFPLFNPVYPFPLAGADQWWTFTSPLLAVNLALFTAGAALLLWRGLRRTRRDALPAGELILLIWGLVIITAGLLWARVRVAGLALPIHPFVILVQAAGLLAVLEWISARFSTRALMLVSGVWLGAAGLLVRFWDLWGYYPSYDECRKLLAIRGTDLLTVWEQSREVVVPPLELLVLFLARQISSQPLFMKLVSLIPGAAMVFILYLLGRRAAGRVGGLVSAVTAAFAYGPMLVSGVIRPHLLSLMLLSLACLYFLKGSDRTGWRDLLSYFILMILAVGVHYSAGVVLAALLLVRLASLLLRRRPLRDVLAWSALNLIAAALSVFAYWFRMGSFTALIPPEHWGWLTPYFPGDIGGVVKGLGGGLGLPDPSTDRTVVRSGRRPGPGGSLGQVQPGSGRGLGGGPPPGYRACRIRDIPPGGDQTLVISLPLSRYARGGPDPVPLGCRRSFRPGGTGQGPG